MPISNFLHQIFSGDINSDGSDGFEIFGIKLHFDDIILVCLLFFLYSEGIEDNLLFMVLILLLLS